MALVKDIMKADVATIDGDDTILNAALGMKKRDVSCLIVSKEGKAFGMITERDIIRRVICEGRNPAETNVRAVMSSPLIAVNPLMTLEEAADVLNQSGVKRLGVVSANKLEGIVTATDLIVAETRLIKMLERYVQLLKMEGQR